MKPPIIVLAAIVLGTAVPASAGTLVIPYRDLDMSTVADRDRLVARIDRRARNICRVGREPRDSPRVRECYAYVLAQAKTQFDAIVAEHRLGG